MEMPGDEYEHSSGHHAGYDYHGGGDYIYYDDYYSDNHTWDSEYFRGAEVYQKVLVAGILPVCVLGLAANMVSVWVWSSLKKSNSVVLLFQCLGVLDSVFLLLSAVRGGMYYRNQLSSLDELYLLPMLFISQSLSVHITMIIGVFRWLLVAKPHGSRIMKRRYVLMTCGGAGAWCALLTVLMAVVEVKFERHDMTYVVTTVVLQIVGFILPTLVLLVFSIGLLRITFRHQRLQSKKKHRKTTLAVLSIAACSFLACPVGVTAHLMVTFAANNGENGCSWTCIFGAFSAGDLLQVLNSSVNFLFYFFFASTFRPLLRHLFRRYTRRFRTGQRRMSTSSGVLRLSTDSGSTNVTGGKSLDSKDELTELPREEPRDEPRKEPRDKEPRDEEPRDEEPRHEPRDEEPRHELREEPRDEEPREEARERPTAEEPEAEPMVATSVA